MSKDIVSENILSDDSENYASSFDKALMENKLVLKREKTTT
jgi:hypothetical protein